MDEQNELIVTVDFEERYHGLMSVPEGEYSNYASHLCEVTPRILDIFDKYNVKATFFVLGKTADRNPGLVEEIAERGHEIASHAWSHRQMGDLTLDEFRREVRQSRDCLERLSRDPVLGFRAPYFSLTTENVPEYFDVLREEGYEYDSSFNPTVTPLYGDRSVPDRPKDIRGIYEIPMSSVNLGGYHWPVTGGFTFRFLPLFLIKTLVRRSLEQRGEPVVFYVHPWSFESTEWSLWRRTTLREKITHFYGRLRIADKLKGLLSEFNTTTAGEYYRKGSNRV